MQIITDFCEPKLNFIVQKNVKKVTGVHILLKISGNYLLYNIFTFVGKHTIKTLNQKYKLLQTFVCQNKIVAKRRCCSKQEQ